MFSKPQWYKMLPNSVKPIDEQTIERVEIFRNKYPGFTHERMFMAIMVSRWAVKRIQKYTVELIKSHLPTASERELWRRVLLARLAAKLNSPPETDPFAKPLSKEEILSRIENMDNIVSNFKSFDDVVDYIIQIDEEENRFYDPTGMQSELDNLLEI
jgi:hypothetical protein